MSVPQLDAQREAFVEASRFRSDFYASLTARRDELFELMDALLCADGPVTAPVDPTLLPEHRRGHGALYDALNRGRIDVRKLRRTLAALPQPKAARHRLVLAVDVSNWLRPDAECSADRLFCHTFGRGRDQHLMIPGWPYSFVAALESGRTSWCQLLDAVRLGPEDDIAEITAAQVRRVVEDLIGGGQWREGDPAILIVFDAGYDAPRLAHLLDGLPVEVLGRLRSDRVMRKPVPRPWICPPQGGRPPKHGKEFRFAKPETWGDPDAATVQVTDRYGTAQATAWDRIHPRLTTRSAWIDHDGELPLIEGTLIRLQVDHLPGGGEPLPLWLWSSRTDMAWSGGRPAMAGIPEALRSGAHLSDDQADPWLDPPKAPHSRGRGPLDLADHYRPHPAPPCPSAVPGPPPTLGETSRDGRLTPARVRRGFRNLRAHLPCPARAPKPNRPGPGRPLGSKKQRLATRYDVGKTVRRPETITQRDQVRP